MALLFKADIMWSEIYLWARKKKEEKCVAVRVRVRVRVRRTVCLCLPWAINPSIMLSTVQISQSHNYHYISTLITDNFLITKINNEQHFCRGIKFNQAEVIKLIILLYFVFLFLSFFPFYLSFRNFSPTTHLSPSFSQFSFKPTLRCLSGLAQQENNRVSDLLPSTPPSPPSN